MRRLTWTLLLLFAALAVFLLRSTPPAPPSNTSPPPPVSRVTEQKEKKALSLDSKTPPAAHVSDQKVTLPPLDNAALQQEVLSRPKHLRNQFASARKVDIDLNRHGVWAEKANTYQWTLEIESTGAENLNFGFSEFSLPTGATFEIRSQTDSDHVYQFTSSDNDSHGQLWTPILNGDTATLALSVPQQQAAKVRLKLSQVSHGFFHLDPFRGKITGSPRSGSCNIDVVCSALDDANFGPLIDLYRDQIRSVAAYTLNGINQCSGALINNTENDLRPLFLTANHCAVTPQNAASLVAFWNFQNSSCRTVGSTASGLPGDGPTTQFNTGAIFLSSRAQSDFCLIEFDDPVNQDFLPFYAGWDRQNADVEFTFGVHHPAVSEKRISFDLDSTARTTGILSNTVTPSGSHFRVQDWDFGTTEGGSSGSPLFNQKGQIIGQLHGGDAACGNNRGDWYGRIFSSWEGEGTSATRLRDWLDPSSSGVTEIDGINGDEIISVAPLALQEGNAGTTTATITLSLNTATPDSVSVTLRTVDGTARSADGDYTPIDQVITFSPNTTTATIDLALSGDLTPEENETLTLVLSNPENAQIVESSATVTILNDDFITPEINSPETATTTQGDTFSYKISAFNTPTRYDLADAPAGMSVNEQTGVVNWVSDQIGTVTFTVIAANDAGSGQQTVTLSIAPPSLMNALELVESIEISSPAPGWARQTTTTFDGVDAAASQNQGSSNSSARMSFFVQGPQIMTFRWKVSSQANSDILSFNLNGTKLLQISGDVDWREQRIVIPSGVQTVEWVYAKDASGNNGDDTAWVDSISFLDTDAPGINMLTTYFFKGESSVSLPVMLLNEAETVTFTNLPSWLTPNPENTILSGTAPASGTFTFGVQASNTAGTDSADVQLEIAGARRSSLATSLDAPSIHVTTAGDRDWRAISDTTATGNSAVRSGIIGNSRDSILNLYVRGPGKLTFNWMVSSEENFDRLLLLLNGDLIDNITGEVPWTEKELILSNGLQHISFIYAKDVSLSSGQDHGQVDNLRLTGFSSFITENAVDHFVDPAELDADQDGLSLFAEYALATPPSGENSYSNFETTMSLDTGIEFQARRDAEDVEFQLQISDSLLPDSWIPMQQSLTETIIDETHSRYRFGQLPVNDEKAFFRILLRPTTPR